MMLSKGLFLIVSIKLLSLFAESASQKIKIARVEQINEGNWDRMLTGEWMVEFYAPWCPACKALEPIWEGLGTEKEELGINVGKVDVTNAPGLSGRFMVTALPTIYHVKDGIFRQYKSPRDADSLRNFVLHKTWEKVEPVQSWKSPTSIQMSIISRLFTISQLIRDVHDKLIENFGLPIWGSYVIFAVVTIIFGAVLGLIIVCIIDFIHPPKDPHAKETKGSNAPSISEKVLEEKDIIDLKDDLVDEEANDSEKSDKSESSEVEKQSNPSNSSSPNVRKRKSRREN